MILSRKSEKMHVPTHPQLLRTLVHDTICTYVCTCIATHCIVCCSDGMLSVHVTVARFTLRWHSSLKLGNIITEGKDVVYVCVCVGGGGGGGGDKWDTHTYIASMTSTFIQWHRTYGISSANLV